MLGDGDRGILRDITSYLGGALLDDEASESAKVNIVVGDKRISDVLHVCLLNRLHQNFLGAGTLGDLINNISLSHSN